MRRRIDNAARRIGSRAMIVAGRGFGAAATALRIGAGWCLNRAADCAILAVRWWRPLVLAGVFGPTMAWASPGDVVHALSGWPSAVAVYLGASVAAALMFGAACGRGGWGR